MVKTLSERLRRREQIKGVVFANRRLIGKEVANETGISHGSRKTIFTMILDMKRTVTKFVPKLIHFQ